MMSFFLSDRLDRAAWLQARERENEMKAGESQGVSPFNGRMWLRDHYLAKCQVSS